VSELDQQDDVVLVARSRGGDRDAWAALCRRHAPRLAAYLGARLHRPALVEKLVGDAVVAGWRTLSELPPGDDFAAWFRRVGAGLALRWRNDHPDEKLKEPFPEERCPDGPEQVERMRRLQDALRRLAEPERMALEQRFRGGLAGKELGDALHLDAAAAEAALERALAALDRELGA
jgi:RNA polymerase sigma-70 factor (ECF subfamily)